MPECPKIECCPPDIYGYQPTFTATASFTALCPVGESGIPQTATKTATSVISYEDAYSNALTEAQAEAEALLECAYDYSFVGTVFLGDSNWIARLAAPTSDDLANVRLFCETFFTGQKNIQCQSFAGGAVAAGIYYVPGVYIEAPAYVGAPDPAPNGEYAPTLHEALDGEGYIFTGVDMEQANAHEEVIYPFILPLSINSKVFSSTFLANLLEISRKVPLLIWGEWSPWNLYDNRILEALGYAFAEVHYSNDASTFSPTLISSGHPLGDALISTGVTSINTVGTAQFVGTVVAATQFAKCETVASFLFLPAR